MEKDEIDYNLDAIQSQLIYIYRQTDKKYQEHIYNIVDQIMILRNTIASEDE
jgi:hypothetical protein